MSAHAVYRTLLDQMMEAIDVGGPDECWPWRLSTRNGYGQVNVGFGRILRCHRVMYALAHGPIPEGMDVLHSCDNRPCCNPRHLSLGTHAENMAQMVERQRSRRKETHCKHGHEFTEANTYWQNGRRCCRACVVRRTTAYRRRKASHASA